MRQGVRVVLAMVPSAHAHTHASARVTVEV